MGPVRQNPIQRTASSYVCAMHCAQLLHSIAQNRPDNFPSYPRGLSDWCPCVNAEWLPYCVVTDVVYEMSVGECCH